VTINAGPMQLEQPEPLDDLETYFTGTMPSGGYWTILSRLSSHDHSGGLLGNPVAVTIPDGSITTADLDPSVLAPYALTDGSKPFTGRVTMQTDAVIRDALLFGEQGTALAPDATIARTGVGALRVDTTLGVGVAPAAWQATRSVVQVGQMGALWADAAAPNTRLSSNTYFDGTAFRPLAGGVGASSVEQANGGLTVGTAPAVGAGAAQTFTTRLALAPAGTLSLTPDATSAALTTPQLSLSNQGANALISAVPAAQSLLVHGTSLAPDADNATSCGFAGLRWTTVYAVAGTINTSLADAKQDITPLDPAAAMTAVRNTTPCTFDYLPPERSAEWYELPDDPEQAEAVLYQRLVSGPLEEAARHQHGVVLNSPDFPCDPLFQTGSGQTNPSSSVGVLLAALRNIDQRLAALETP
jgi:hypothetical protein